MYPFLDVFEMPVSFFGPRTLLAHDDGSAARAALEGGVALDFETVYEAHFDFVYRVVARLVANPNDVEDLTQEVFMVVSRRLGEFRGDARITTWLFRIAYRVVGAHIRRSRIRRALAAWLGIEGASAHAEAIASGPDRFEEARKVRNALASLSYEKRSALVLFEVEGWSAAEIADMLEIPVGTVYTRVHHARRAFRQAYDESKAVRS